MSDRTEWRPSSPATIEADLSGLWRDAAHDGPVSRALLSNLVVLSGRRSFPDVEDVARRHPARTVLLSYTPGASSARTPEAVRVGLIVFGEGDVRYGVELIAIHTACAEHSIPSILRRVSRGGVPCSVWWSDAQTSPLPSESIAAVGRQLVYDSAFWHDARAGAAAATRLLDSPHAPDLADLNWRRLGTLRAALVHAIRAETSRDLSRAQVDIGHAPSQQVAGALMRAWLMSRCADVFSVRPPGLRATASEADVSVRLTLDGWSLVASINARRVRVEADGRQPFEMPAGSTESGEAVAAELRMLGRDPQLADALRTLAATVTE